MLTIVNIVIIEPICYLIVILFMEAVLQQSKKRVNVKQKESRVKIDEENIGDVLSRYFIWFASNNIEEYKTFTKFWNQKLLEHVSVFAPQSATRDIKRSVL